MSDAVSFAHQVGLSCLPSVIFSELVIVNATLLNGGGRRSLFPAACQRAFTLGGTGFCCVNVL